MHRKKLSDCPAFIAGDRSLLRELLNPRTEPVDIRYSLAWAMVRPGAKTSTHRLAHAEVYFIIHGTGKVYINNEESVVHEYETVYIPPNALQHIENIGHEDLEFLCIVDPAWHPEVEVILEK